MNRRPSRRMMVDGYRLCAATAEARSRRLAGRRRAEARGPRQSSSQLSLQVPLPPKQVQASYRADRGKRGGRSGRRGRGRNSSGHVDRETPEGSDSQGNKNGIGAETVLPPARTEESGDVETSDGESPFWRHEFGPQYDEPAELTDSAPRRSKAHVDSAEEIISSALTHMGLERSPRILITANSPTEPTCLVPTPLIALTRTIRRHLGTLDDLNSEPSRGEESQMVVSLEPTISGIPLDENTPSFPTITLAEEFINHPGKTWLSTGAPQLKPEMFHSEKLLIWARALLVSKLDSSFLGRAGILRGVLGSLYEVPLKWPLIQAFVTFWNSEGHTLVTSQGEMGFPLLTLQDSMGIPISGRVYDEYVPDSCFKDEVAAVLFSAYAVIRKSAMERDQSGDGLVTLTEWIDYFLTDAARVENSPKISLPSNFYADVDDPLLERLNFRMTQHRNKSMPLCVYFSDQVMQFNAHYSRTHLRAAFVAAWLCSYCVPVGMGAIICPEVFMAAASIASGVRRAIGVASMAYLYESLDAVQAFVRRGTRSSSRCRLSLPTHFIMGWFACHWKAMPAEPTIITSVTKFPPFISEIWKASEMNITLEDAHHLFLDVDVQQHRLMHLDFLGRLVIRFPEDAPNHIVDQRYAPKNKRQLRISEVDLLVSSSVGGVSHRRCQIHNNQVYCPQRFARMLNCDQAVPDMNMDGLLRADHFEGNMGETTELLRRRLLAYWLPDGHTFVAQVRGRVAACSIGYMSWCKAYLGFLRDANNFCVGIASPTAEEKGKNATETASDISDLPPSKGGVEAAECSIGMNRMEEEPVVLSTETDAQVPIVDLVDCDADAAGTEHEMVGNDVPLTTVAHDSERKSQAKQPTEPKVSATKRKNSDAQDGGDGGKPKRGRTSRSKQVNAWNAATSKETVKKLSSDIKLHAEAFEKSAKATLNSNIPSFDPAPDKYDGVSGVILRASDITDESQRDFFLYARQDLQLLQTIASVAELDKPMLAERIDKVLARWAKLFSAQISEGLGKMTEALKELRELLVGDHAPLLPLDASTIASQKIQVQEVLKEATAIRKAIPATLAKIQEVEVVAKMKCEALAACKKQQEEKIAKLKASLELAEADLKKTENHHVEIEEFFKNSETAQQDLNKLSAGIKENADRAELAKAEVEKRMEYIGDNSGASQPKLVRSLLAFLHSSSYEE